MELYGMSLPPPGQILYLLIVLTLTIYTITRKRYRLPPGPRALPLVGNIFDVPSTFQWFTYEELGRKYNSPIVHLNMFGTHMMVVNDYEVAHNLLEKSGTRYGDRPRFKFLREIAGHDFNFAFAPLNAYWKQCRRNFDNQFKLASVKKMRPRITQSIHNLFLRRLVEHPADFAEHCHFMAVASSLDMAYGLDIRNDNDPFLNIVHECLQSHNESANYQHVDVFPWLAHLPEWLPGMDWKLKVPRWRDANFKMRNLPFDSVVNSIKEHTARPSVASSLLEAEERPSEQVIKDTTVMIIAGSVDTLVAMLQCTFLVLSLFPETQRAAQDELDSVVGSERLPTFDDEPDLPYVKAFYREVLRWACVGPLTVPHMSMEDDVWTNEGKNYFIPKGSLVVGNSWAMCRDERMYPDSHEFRPTRYLDANGRLNPEVREPDMIFGYRPRHCPGKCVETEDGMPPETTDWSKLMKPGMVIYPHPFKVQILLRSENAADLVRQAEVHTSA